MPDNKDDVTLLAETNFRGSRQKFGIKRDDRRRHMYVIGKTGMGKSVFLENMIISDIRAGNGVAVVDPHGDLVDKVINFIPPHRINDVVYFNPADMEHPVAFNILEKVEEEHKHLVAAGLMSVFKKIWENLWSARMEYILNNTILALLDYPDSTLLGIMRMLTDKEFRGKVVAKVTDPVVQSFWIDEFAKYPDKYQKEAVAPIQNKVGQFLSSALIRDIVGQVKSTIKMREIMDTKKILLMNLSKGRLGEDNSGLLGGMLITKIQLAAMERVNIPEDERKDFYLYVDEFQNFSTSSFANILSEARKYRLNLIVAHQYIEQLSDEVKAAIFGNVGTMVSFRVGAEDGEFLAKEFEPQFTETDLVNLTKYTVYMKLMINGVASTPFSAATLPPATGMEDNKDTIVKVSRERYAEPRAVVEDKIKRWSGLIDESGKERALVDEEGESTAGKNQTECWACGKKTYVIFEPDGIRPIYCKSCLKKLKEGKIEPVPPREPPKEEKAGSAAPAPGIVKPAVSVPAVVPAPTVARPVVSASRVASSVARPAAPASGVASAPIRTAPAARTAEKKFVRQPPRGGIQDRPRPKLRYTQVPSPAARVTVSSASLRSGPRQSDNGLKSISLAEAMSKAPTDFRGQKAVRSSTPMPAAADRIKNPAASVITEKTEQPKVAPIAESASASNHGPKKEAASMPKAAGEPVKPIKKIAVKSPSVSEKGEDSIEKLASSVIAHINPNPEDKKEGSPKAGEGLKPIKNKEKELELKPEIVKKAGKPVSPMQVPVSASKPEPLKMENSVQPPKPGPKKELELEMVGDSGSKIMKEGEIIRLDTEE